MKYDSSRHSYTLLRPETTSHITFSAKQRLESDCVLKTFNANVVRELKVRHNLFMWKHAIHTAFVRLFTVIVTSLRHCASKALWLRSYWFT